MGLRLSLGVWTLTGAIGTGLLLWPPAPVLKALSRADLPFSYLLWVVCGLHPDPPPRPGRPASGPAIFRGRGLAAQRPAAAGPGAGQPGALAQGVGPPGALPLAAAGRPGGGVPLFQGLSFYSGQIFYLMESRTELDFGRRLVPELERQLYFTNVEAMTKFAGPGPRSFFI